MVNKIAVYWDFENIHASLCTVTYGPKWYYENRYSRQPDIVDITSIMEYIASVGDININKAYANWSFFYPYNFMLQEYALDLVQLFPRGSHGKNGADIRMAIDVIEDLNSNPHIDTIVLIGGDSDYIAIAQRVRQKGKEIIGIGVKETTNQYWIKSCNQFKFYASLRMKSASISSMEEVEYQIEDLEDAKDLLSKAITKIMSESGEPFARKAAIKPMMIRLDSSFDETNFGFTNFSSFLDACDFLSIVQGEHDHLVTMKGKNDCDGFLEERENISDTEAIYGRILKKQQIRLPQPQIMIEGLRESHRLFQASDGGVDSYVDFKNLLMRRMEEREFCVTETDVSKIKALIYKAFGFRIDPSRSRILLSEDIASESDLLWRVFRMLVKRVSDNIEGKPDTGTLSEMLYGDDQHLSQVEEMIRAVG
jgi:uncharacterized protein (TIGR00288 family)